MPLTRTTCLGWMPAFLARMFLARARRRRLRAMCSGAWLSALESLPFVPDLTTARLRLLVGLARDFEKRVRWKGIKHWRPDARARAAISLEACRLVLNLGLERYERLHTVRVVPAMWSASDGTKLAGEATGDTVKIAWNVARASTRRSADGFNVVYHEFAHVLDHQDGHFDGMPVLRTHRERAGWLGTFDRGLSALRDILSRREPSVLREYGQSDPVEFFAVCTETFFERPRALRARHPEVYSALARFYRQDPAGRGRRAGRSNSAGARLGV